MRTYLGGIHNLSGQRFGLQQLRGSGRSKYSCTGQINCNCNCNLEFNAASNRCYLEKKKKEEKKTTTLTNGGCRIMLLTAASRDDVQLNSPGVFEGTMSVTIGSARPFPSCPKQTTVMSCQVCFFVVHFWTRFLR